MTFSIIVPTKDRILDLQNCIRSIINQTVLPQELVIVDASIDSIIAENQKNCKNIIRDKIKLIYIRSTPGLCKQRNIGADCTNSDIVFFVDDDIVLKEDYAEKILEVYKIKSGKNIGGVRGSLIEYFNEKWISRTFRKLFFMTRGSINEKSRFLPSLCYVYIYMPKKIIEVEAMQTAVCTFYREIFNEFKFDEAFPRCNDLDISYRVSRKYKMYQTPYALAHHNHSLATHPDVRNLNRLYIFYSHKLAKKFLSTKDIKWLAYYWSIIGELLLAALKSCGRLNPDYLLGTIDGIKCILLNKSYITK